MSEQSFQEQTLLAFNLFPRPNSTPAWAQKVWFVHRQQYLLGAVRWDDRKKCYTFRAEPNWTMNCTELFYISEFLREETLNHRRELWVRNCNRTSRQAGRKLNAKQN